MSGWMQRDAEQHEAEEQALNQCMTESNQAYEILGAHETGPLPVVARKVMERMLRFEAALRRLSSMEAFTGARAIKPQDEELIARIDFARATLEEPVAAPAVASGA